jgi:hypothetical protein
MFVVTESSLESVLEKIGCLSEFVVELESRRTAMRVAGKKAWRAGAWRDVVQNWLRRPGFIAQLSVSTGETQFRLGKDVFWAPVDGVASASKATRESPVPPLPDWELEKYPDPTLFLEPTDREPDVKAARKWVWQHLGWPNHLLKPEICPNSTTWRLLLQAREDETWFIEKVYSGIKPGKSEIDEERKRDESLPILDLIQKVRSTIKT